MAQSDGGSNVKAILIGAIVAIAVGGSAPWWWAELKACLFPKPAEGWYGWVCNPNDPKRQATNCDQNENLGKLVGGINRVLVPQKFIAKHGWTLDAVCASLDMKCIEVKAWNGGTGSCAYVAPGYPQGDGSQIGHCQP